MRNEPHVPLVLALDDASAIREQVGGKGTSSAHMAAAGLPTLLGFHVATAAYRRFVTENELQEAHRFAKRFGGIRICASEAASLDRHVTPRK